MDDAVGEAVRTWTGVIRAGRPSGQEEHPFAGLEGKFVEVSLHSKRGDLKVGGFLDSDQGVYGLMDYEGGGEGDVYLTELLGPHEGLEATIAVAIFPARVPPEGEYDPVWRYPLSRQEAAGGMYRFVQQFSGKGRRPRLMRSQAERVLAERMSELARDAPCFPGLRRPGDRYERPSEREARRRREAKNKKRLGKKPKNKKGPA